MSLTVALAILGGLVLVAVLAHGAWQTRRAQPRRPQKPAGPRTEPVLETSPATADATRIEPGLAQDAAAFARAPVPRKALPLDALIDAIVPLGVDSPVSGEAVLAHWPATQRAGTKPFAIEGLDTRSGQWEAPLPGHQYSELQAGVQLANRSGALNEIEYSEFVQKIQGFADALAATPDFPDMLEVVARARELDAFASPLDAQLVLKLRTRGASWSVAYLQQCAQRNGFVAGVMPGRMVMPSGIEGDPPMLVLGFDPNAALAEDAALAAVREVDLSLDVPQTPSGAEPFPAWHRAATDLAREMDADMLDDAGAPLRLQAFAGIGQQLAGLYDALQSRDLAAGSAAARRLFSG